MSIKAKFRCEQTQDSTFAGTGNTQRKVIFRAVYGNTEENKSFSKATPSGNLEIVIDKETAAYEFFIPGKEYYLELTEASAI